MMIIIINNNNSNNNKGVSKTHIDKRRGAVKIMCNTPSGNISVADCVPLSSLQGVSEK